MNKTFRVQFITILFWTSKTNLHKRVKFNCKGEYREYFIDLNALVWAMVDKERPYTVHTIWLIE